MSVFSFIRNFSLCCLDETDSNNSDLEDGEIIHSDDNYKSSIQDSNNTNSSSIHGTSTNDYMYYNSSNLPISGVQKSLFTNVLLSLYSFSFHCHHIGYFIIFIFTLCIHAIDSLLEFYPKFIFSTKLNSEIFPLFLRFISKNSIHLT